MLCLNMRSQLVKVDAIFIRLPLVFQYASKVAADDLLEVVLDTVDLWRYQDSKT